MAKGGDWVIGRDVDPGSPLTNFNDRGGERGSYFIPKKSQLQNVSTQKSHYFFSIPKKFLNPVFAAQKILVSFIDSKESLLAKISDQKNNSDPPPHH